MPWVRINEDETNGKCCNLKDWPLIDSVFLRLQCCVYNIGLILYQNLDKMIILDMNIWFWFGKNASLTEVYWSCYGGIQIASHTLQSDRAARDSRRSLFLISSSERQTCECLVCTAKYNIHISTKSLNLACCWSSMHTCIFNPHLLQAY